MTFKNYFLKSLAAVIVFLLIGCSDEETVVDPIVPLEDFLGHRGELYDTQYPTERANLKGNRNTSNGGFRRNTNVDNIEVSTIEMPYPIMLFTRDDDEVFVLGGTPLIIEDNVASIDGLPPGDSETAPYFAKYTPSTGAITYIDLDRGQGLPYLAC